jgi:hypothetical protein
VNTRSVVHLISTFPFEEHISKGISTYNQCNMPSDVISTMQLNLIQLKSLTDCKCLTEQTQKSNSELLARKLRYVRGTTPIAIQLFFQSIHQRQHQWPAGHFSSNYVPQSSSTPVGRNVIPQNSGLQPASTNYNQKSQLSVYHSCFLFGWF